MLKIIIILLGIGVCVSGYSQGKNMISDPGAENPVSIKKYPGVAYLTTKCPDGFYALGWGVYNGGGKMCWGVTSSEFHSGKKSVFIRILAPVRYKKRLLYSGALLLGEGDGYQGDKSLEVKPNTRYKFSVWVKTSEKYSLNVYATAYLMRQSRYFRTALPITSLLVDGVSVISLNNNYKYTVATDSTWRRLDGIFITKDDTEYVNIGLQCTGFVGENKKFTPITLFADDAEVLKQ